MYIGETGGRVADGFREHLQEVEKKTTLMHPNLLGTILVFLITPTTTWQFAAYPFTLEKQKGTKLF